MLSIVCSSSNAGADGLYDGTNGASDHHREGEPMLQVAVLGHL